MGHRPLWLGVIDYLSAMSWRKRRKEQTAWMTLARAERQQQFLTNARVHVFEIQRVLALVAQDFKHRRPAFFGDLNPRVVQVYDVHLERLHQESLIVPAT